MRSLSEMLGRCNFRGNIIKLLQVRNKEFYLGMQHLRYLLDILVEMPGGLLNFISGSKGYVSIMIVTKISKTYIFQTET